MMAQANEKIGRQDVEKFIVKHPYGVPGNDWPHSTVVLSTVRIDNDPFLTKIFKNDSQPGKKIHAEIKFLAFLKDKIKNYKGASVKVRLVQNYSPCGDCADEILKFIDENNASFTIKFANFYFHDRPNNKNGLKKLLRNRMINLELIQGADTWKKFLDDETFVALSPKERPELLKMATAEDRQTREEDDVAILDDIESEDKDLADKLKSVNILNA